MKTILRKTLLYQSGVEYADYCINHVEGCSHGCRFPCYAYMMKKRYGVVQSYKDWIQPKLVANALEILDGEIITHKKKIHSVHLCFSTDPFMYGYQEVADLTLKIIEKLNKNAIYCTTLTKGIYPFKLTDKDKYVANNRYGITIVSLSDEFKKRFEPYSAPYKERIESLKKLHENGLKTWVSIEPYPTPNLIKQDLTEILNEVSFADRIIFGKLNYNVESNHFRYNSEFYRECSNIVIEYCEKNNIEYYIKQGTQKDDNKKYKKILDFL